MRQHPTVRGIVEHIDRAAFFATEARETSDSTSAFRLWMAAVYSLRAAVQLMRDTANRGELTVDLRQLDRIIVVLVPRWRLVHKLRIRDFHHTGVHGPGHMQFEFRLRLPALGKGNIHFRVNPSSPGLQVGLSDGSRNYRFFLTSGLLVQDHREPRPIPLSHLVREQLTQLPRALHTFVQVLRS